MQKYDFLGLSDKGTCDCCGKKNISKTVCLELKETGDEIHMGTHCAARALGWGVAKADLVQEKARAAEKARPVFELAMKAMRSDHDFTKARELAKSTWINGMELNIAYHSKSRVATLHWNGGSRELPWHDLTPNLAHFQLYYVAELSQVHEIDRNGLKSSRGQDDVRYLFEASDFLEKQIEEMQKKGKVPIIYKVDAADVLRNIDEEAFGPDRTAIFSPFALPWDKKKEDIKQRWMDSDLSWYSALKITGTVRLCVDLPPSSLNCLERWKTREENLKSVKPDPFFAPPVQQINMGF
ncbi:hypothetical protein ACQU0X_27310 [Pseudovibrio ascidiaceicola]|uniref:hypothetical protein n=1 Tax=Pseudovibrio ascidiaceicola TaxID=285279 RepID=UPI003D368AFB